MQKSILAFLSFSTVILLSCSFLGKYSEVEYNNFIVEPVNATSLALENTTTLYKETLPDVVTEQSVIDISKMQEAYDEAQDKWSETESLLTLESRNLEQQNAVRTELETYRTAADLYFQSYDAILTYYGEETYKTDLTQVEVLDENMHTAYTTFIAANNDLVDILESFVNPGEED